jgi:hypothetical protein
VTDECVWAYCPGTNGSHWAYVPCHGGFNYLSKLKSGDPYVGVADWYAGCLCPNCWKPIRLDYARLLAHGGYEL